MIFNAEDVEPYRLHMIKVFDKIFREAHSGNQEAVGILKRLLKEFGKVPGADYQAWLGRRMAESMPNDLMCIMAKDAIRQNPDQFNELVERFLNGENLAQTLSLLSA